MRRPAARAQHRRHGCLGPELSTACMITPWMGSVAQQPKGGLQGTAGTSSSIYSGLHFCWQTGACRWQAALFTDAADTLYGLLNSHEMLSVRDPSCSPHNTAHVRWLSDLTLQQGRCGNQERCQAQDQRYAAEGSLREPHHPGDCRGSCWLARLQPLPAGCRRHHVFVSK